MTATKNAWVISVKYGVGCYRHLQVLKQETLAELADDILWAFDFDNDHAHAFFLDNQCFSKTAAYYPAYFDEENKYPHTDDTTLTVLSLKQPFIFFFDFGDAWEFQCKVLREVSTDEPETCLVRSVGEPPEQYPDYDENGLW